MDTSLLTKLMTAPEEAISHLNLVYVTDDKMPIIRERIGSDFEYRFMDRPLEQRKDVARIKALVIPPAWEKVKITHLPHGHLQATGRDAKRRKQYRYHELWTKIRMQTKFYRMGIFGSALPHIREIVDLHLEQNEWIKTKVMALVVRLMEETHIRIGNEQYAKRNKTYGLSTLRKRHVAITKNGLRLNFTGKRGKKHTVTIRNQKLVRLVGQCEEIPGWELFHYYDVSGKKQAIDSSMVNTYLKEIGGHDFTAKDFRTWAAGIVFFNALMTMEAASDQKTIKQNILIAYDETAKALGNTRKVCRTSYVHPLLPMSYENGTLEQYAVLAKNDTATTPNFSPSESAVLQLISNYEPNFKITNNENRCTKCLERNDEPD